MAASSHDPPRVNESNTRDPHWQTTGNILTVQERIGMIDNYLRERRLAGYELTASGFSIFLATNGIKLAKGTLKTKYLPGTNYQLSPRGTKLCYHSIHWPEGPTSHRHWGTQTTAIDGEE